MAGSGVNNTSALAFGGSGVVANTESWNGVVWTETNDLNTARDYLGGSGTETSALAYGGEPVSPAVQAFTESWNGSSWTEVSDMNIGKSGPYSAGESNATALASGGEKPSGSPAIGAETELWNGGSWTEVADMNSARMMGAFSNTGTVSSAINIGGGPAGSSALTEEWSGSTNLTKTIDTD